MQKLSSTWAVVKEPRRSKWPKGGRPWSLELTSARISYERQHSRRWQLKLSIDANSLSARRTGRHYRLNRWVRTLLRPSSDLDADGHSSETRRRVVCELRAYVGLFSVFPWAHLVFSEDALIRWRSDFNNNGATLFHELAGGLNQMTIARFERLVAHSRFPPVSVKLVPIRRLRLLHHRLTREFTNALVVPYCALAQES